MQQAVSSLAFPSTGWIKALAVTDWSSATFTPTDASAATMEGLPTTQYLNNVRGWSHPSREALEDRLKHER